MIADDEVLLAIVGAGEDEVVGSETSLEELLARGDADGGDTAVGVFGVSLNELFEDLAREDAVFLGKLGRCWAVISGGNSDDCGDSEDSTNVHALSSKIGVGDSLS